jgi:hypothetical protein
MEDCCPLAPDSPPAADDGLDLPTTLRRCQHCRKPGAERRDDLNDRTVYLHERCVHPWADQQERALGKSPETGIAAADQREQ